MVRLLVGTDSPKVSKQILGYLESRIGEDDTVYVINSLVGGDETSSDEIAEGDEAIEVLEEGLAGRATVETHQYIRGNAPIEDLLEAADEFDIDEHVIGIRKRSPVGKMMFGSTAQNILLESDVPVRCIPLVLD